MQLSKMNIIMATAVVCTILIAGCNGNYDFEKRNATTDLMVHNSANNETSYSEYLEKTATINFRTLSTTHTYKFINDVAAGLGGLVMESRVDPRIDKENIVQLAGDSLDVVKISSLRATMIVKIPSEHCDAFIDSIAGKMVEPELMQFKVNDLRKNFASNKIKTATNESEKSDIAADNYNLSAINKRIEYSTIQLSFYELPSITHTHQLDVERLSKAETAFSVLAAEAFEKSLHNIRAIVLFAIRYWSVLLLICAIIFGFIKLIVQQKVMLPRYDHNATSATGAGK